MPFGPACSPSKYLSKWLSSLFPYLHSFPFKNAPEIFPLGIRPLNTGARKGGPNPERTATNPCLAAVANERGNTHRQGNRFTRPQGRHPQGCSGKAGRGIASHGYREGTRKAVVVRQPAFSLLQTTILMRRNFALSAKGAPDSCREVFRIIRQGNPMPLQPKSDFRLRPPHP